MSAISDNILHETAGMFPLIDFLENHYINEYILNGGSKIKFVTGRQGSGKTHLLGCLEKKARENGFKTVRFSAKEISLYDFKDIYIEILSQCDIVTCLKKCVEKIVLDMGDDVSDIPDGMKYVDYLASEGRLDPLVKKELRNQLRDMFLSNTRMDNNFALCASLLTGDLLGHPLLESSSREILMSWMMADKSVKLALIRSLGLLPGKITKQNARHMLRSLVQVLLLGGYKGLLVLVDDMEVMLNQSGLDQIHYTKLRREDTYESIRQLIDEIDTMSNMMFVYAFDRAMLDNDNAGVKSYQALWMRIQNEIVGNRMNMFSDMIDLDKYAQQFYSKKICIDISAIMADKYGGRRISEEMLEKIIEKSKLGAIGTAGLIKQYTTGEAVDEYV